MKTVSGFAMEVALKASDPLQFDPLEGAISALKGNFI